MLECRENKGPDQLCGYHAAGLPLCFFAYANSRFCHDAAQITVLFSPYISPYDIV